MKKREISSVVFISLIFLLAVPVTSETFEKRPARTTYHTKSDAIQMYKHLCDQHGDLATYETIGKSFENRDIWLVKVGNPNGGRVMIDGSTHGPEDAGTELSYLFLKWVLESGDAEAEKILYGNYLLIIPIVNMDNYARQNMRRYYTAEESPTGTRIDCPYGVDLNRNAVYGWGQSGSGDPNNNYEYRGAWAGSEPETQAYRNAMETYKPQIYVNTHFGGEYILYRDDASTANITQTVLSLYTNLANQQGVSIYPAKRGIPGGMVAADGYSFGASAWIVEFTLWDNLPADYNQFVSEWYPKAFPLYLAWCKAVQIEYTPPVEPPVVPVDDSQIIIGLMSFAITFTIVGVGLKLWAMWKTEW